MINMRLGALTGNLIVSLTGSLAEQAFKVNELQPKDPPSNSVLVVLPSLVTHKMQDRLDNQLSPVSSPATLSFPVGPGRQSMFTAALPSA